MKYLDRVRIISDDYEEYGIKRGDEGHLLNAEIRYGTFLFFRDNPETGEDDCDADVKISDMELVKDWGMTDEQILNALPNHDPEWWCKVEDGYIWNLKGEKKNKIPYDYDS